MGTPGRPKAELVLTDEERSTLERWARRPSSPQSLALRARIVLACASGKTNLEVAAELSVNKVTVGKWRSRFVDKRLAGLSDEHRPGVPRKITDDHVEAVVVKTLTEKPVDATHWSTRSLAKATGMSQPNAPKVLRLPDGWVLQVSAARDVARTGRVYGGTVAPDQTTAPGFGPAMRAARTWLFSTASCSSAVLNRH